MKKITVSKNSPQKTEEEEFLSTIKKNYKLAEDRWADNRKLAKEDMEFRAGKQWFDDDITQREKDKRPCLVVDKLGQYVRQVVNDGRQNRQAIMVRPVDSGADVETADVFKGLIRHIEDRSNSDIAYDTALECAVVGGFGFFRVLTEYSTQNSFDQEICIKRVRNPMTVLLGEFEEADASDLKEAWFVDEMSKAQFKREYPKAQYTDWQTDGAKYGDDWISEEKVTVCEYWYVEEEQETVHFIEDGTTIPAREYEEAIAEGIIPPAIIESREIPVRKVKWCRLSGAEILERRDWKGKYIPLFIVVGNEYDIDGKITYSGLIRSGKDPARLYNYSRSAFAERVALTPKAPWVAADGQVEDYADEWATANQANISVLKYKPQSIDGHMVPAPQRQTSADIPAGFAQDMQIAEHDIQAALGMYAASVGAPSNERSGKAILARQREGDTSTFHYIDNQGRAIRHLGRVLVDLIPKIYDSRRVVRILGEDGTAKMADIDPDQEVAVKKLGHKSIYNLNVGTYDVSISTGPSYNTKRQEAATSMVEMTQANPELMTVIGDLMVKSMDWPGADEIAARLKAMLPPQVLQAEQEKQGDGQGMSPEMMAMQQGAEAAIAERDAALQQAGEQLQQMNTELTELRLTAKNKEEEAAIKSREADIKAFEAETERMKVEMENGIEKIQTLLSQHESHVKELVSAFQAAQVPAQDQDMEADQQPDANAAMNSEMIAMIQASHDQTMQAISQVAEAMMRPKTMQIQAPSGAVYTGQVQ